MVPLPTPAVAATSSSRTSWKSLEAKTLAAAPRISRFFPTVLTRGIICISTLTGQFQYHIYEGTIPKVFRADLRQALEISPQWWPSDRRERSLVHVWSFRRFPFRRGLDPGDRSDHRDRGSIPALDDLPAHPRLSRQPRASGALPSRARSRRRACH